MQRAEADAHALASAATDAAVAYAPANGGVAAAFGAVDDVVGFAVAVAFGDAAADREDNIHKRALVRFLLVCQS